MPEPTPDRPTPRRTRGRAPALIGVGTFAVAMVAFGFDLGGEPHFVDESAYVSQSGYADLYLSGRWDDPAWLDYAGYDIPPLPKYLVGIALRAIDQPRPAPAAAWAWYRNNQRRFVPGSALVAARVPSVILGALGCVAIGSIGTRAFGRAAGLVASALLMVDPLYRLLARRAMSDAPAEALMLVALALGLAAWSGWLGGPGGVGRWATMVGGAGVAAGLAVAAKLNGAIAVFSLIGWAGLAIGLGLAGSGTGPGWGRVVSVVVATGLACLVAFWTFVALNPFLTARPSDPAASELRVPAETSFRGRVVALIEHRRAVSALAPSQFPHNALTTVRERLAAVAVQGYGRFSPFGPAHSDSTVRYDWRQDRGAVVWIPLVAAGLAVALARGRSQWRVGEPATAWAVAVAAAVAFGAVASFLPLAWDRYYLSLQPGAALLASAALTAPFRRSARAGAPAVVGS